MKINGVNAHKDMKKKNVPLFYTFLLIPHLRYALEKQKPVFYLPI
jgi:hypothetical protein